MHVGAHQSTVRIAVLQEGDQRGSDRYELLGRNVHIIDHFAGKFGDLVSSSAGNAGVQEMPFFVEGFVRLRDDESVFFVGGKVIHDIRHDAFFFIHSSVSRFDKAVFVDFREDGKRSDKTDVLTFRRFDGAHSAVVSIVNVSDFESRSFSVQTARTEGGKFSFMRKFRDGVRLIHELRQLGRSEEFLDRAGNGANVDQSLRGNLFRILRGHSLLDDPFQSRDTDTELILQKFADRAHAAVAEVVDVVHGADTEVQIENHGNGRDDIVGRNMFMV